jgi:signal transduction histidine kinase
MPSLGDVTARLAPVGVRLDAAGDPTLFRRARLRLTAWYLAIVAASFVVLGTAVYLVVSAQLNGDVDDGVRLIGARAETDVLTGDAADIQAIGAQGPYDLVVVRRDPDRLRAFGVGDEFRQLRLPHVPSVRAAARQGQDLRTISTQLGDIRVFTKKMRVGPEVMFVQVARSLEPEQSALGKLLRVLLIGGVGGLALAGIGGWFMAGKALLPLQEALARQRAFVSDASHELRTPLAVIRANAEYIQVRDPGNQEAGEIVHETDRLSGLVASLLALARGDRREAAPAGAVDLGDVVSDAAEGLRPLAGERGVTLSVAAAPGLRVRAGEDQIRQLTVILVDNAIRYTERGGSVDVVVAGDDGEASLRVHDTGIGIGAEALPRVFERFYRADAARNRDSGGAGLGLAIARELAEGMGGSLCAESEPGEGSTFTARLPLER